MFLTALLLSVMLTAPFGEASAVLFEPAPGDFSVELSVQVIDPEVTVVVAQVALLDGRVTPVALVEVEPGRWAGGLTMAHLENARVAFEALAPGQESDISATVSLIDLGVPVETFVDDADPDAGSDEGSRDEGSMSTTWVQFGVVALVGMAVFAVVATLGWRRANRA